MKKNVFFKIKKKLTTIPKAEAEEKKNWIQNNSICCSSK